MLAEMDIVETPWYPLEVVLSAWLDVVDVGKIKAVDDCVEAGEKFKPWVCCHWNEYMVRETVEVFDALVASIESRMRDQGLPLSDTNTPLLLDSILGAADIPVGFARSFHTEARCPGFGYIAPGIAIPNRDSFLQRPFSSIVNEEQDEDADEDELIIPPILLFAYSGIVNLNDKNDRKKKTPLSWPCSQLSSFPAGLYLTESERSKGREFEDGVKFILDFGIGANRFARTSDGVRIGDAADYSERIAELYQLGWNRSINIHEVELLGVLQTWRNMVERGDWKIGAEGVQGSVEGFGEADTEEGWWKFVVPVGW